MVGPSDITVGAVQLPRRDRRAATLTPVLLSRLNDGRGSRATHPLHLAGTILLTPVEPTGPGRLTRAKPDHCTLLGSIIGIPHGPLASAASERSTLNNLATVTPTFPAENDILVVT